MNIFKRKPRDMTLNDTDKNEIGLIKTGDNSWSVVYVEAKEAAHMRAVVKRYGTNMKSASGAYRIYFNR
ncbi:MAG: hypothetical protein QXR73_00075 [Candidatus Micrarchaeaceae archaeon]